MTVIVTSARSSPASSLTVPETTRSAPTAAAQVTGDSVVPRKVDEVPRPITASPGSCESAITSSSETPSAT
ncbi:MAG: hypothetical protein IPN16_15335 [Gemmatimonadetes bacterium]|nr:hypothetical protein [Gemmatimonadota bacterium]